MRDSLRSGDMSSLRGDGFIFSRNVRLDRLALAAGHDLARLVGCGGMTMLLSSSSDIKISGNRSFVWFKRSLPFWGMGRNLLKVKVSSLAGIAYASIISVLHMLRGKININADHIILIFYIICAFDGIICPKQKQ